MGTILEREWGELLKKEERMLSLAEKKKTWLLDEKIDDLADKIEQKIPEKITFMLNDAFYKAFFLIFEKGTDVIEKTFRSEELELEFQVNDFRLSKKPTKRSLKKLEAAGRKSHLLNSCVTTAEGIGLGILGIGVPDIPIFLGMLLKGIYETAASYGYDYNKKEEQILILRMISAGLADGAEKRKADTYVEEWMSDMKRETMSLFEAEVRGASKALSDVMLTAKFVQGLPVVGALGGINNPLVYQKILQYVMLKYKKRYLLAKRKGA